IDTGVDTADSLSLDVIDDAVDVGSLVLIEAPILTSGRRTVAVARSVATRSRSSYSLQGKSTRIELAQPGGEAVLNWRPAEEDRLDVLRTGVAHVRSERLTLAGMPIDAPLRGQTIELETLVDGLVSGRPIIVIGERTDIVTG